MSRLAPILFSHNPDGAMKQQIQFLNGKLWHIIRTSIPGGVLNFHFNTHVGGLQMGAERTGRHQK